MFPVICHIGPFTLYAYGLMLALAVMVASSLAAAEAGKHGVAQADMHDLAFWVVLWGILGARVFYVFLYADHYLEFPLEIVMLQKGGLAWQGSLLAGILAGVLFIRRRKLPLVLLLDIVAPFIALGQAIGRVGCFLNGCCYGKAVAWGVYFPVLGERVHPTQVYMSLGDLGVFLVLRSLQARGGQPAGRLFILYLVLSSAERFLVEFFRGDTLVLWGGLTLFQYTCALFIVVALFINARLRRS